MPQPCDPARAQVRRDIHSKQILQRCSLDNERLPRSAVRQHGAKQSPIDPFARTREQCEILQVSKFNPQTPVILFLDHVVNNEVERSRCRTRNPSHRTVSLHLGR